MRSLSDSLRAAQSRYIGARPYITAEVRQRIAGIRRLDFTRDYEGPQADSFNALTATGDNHILRVWVNPDDDKLYAQKI
jgi:hypothetical protein